MTGLATALFLLTSAPLVGIYGFEPPLLSRPAGEASETAVRLARCSGCGCRGGPGWRDNETGKCVSHKNFKRICGSPPDKKRCTRENGAD